MTVAPRCLVDDSMMALVHQYGDRKLVSLCPCDTGVLSSQVSSISFDVVYPP